MGKRVFDLVLAGLGLLLLSPVLAAIALWVRFDSPGPVFYRQERVGWRGVPFRIHKFRTMVDQADTKGPQITVGKDPRITRAGHWLRRSKLDELPQLIDVIQGTMSLVGPRPEVARYVAHYTEVERAQVLSVRPGITDFASIAFRDESRLLAKSSDPERTYVDVVLPQKLVLARAYVEQASLRTDVMVLTQTLAALLSRHGDA